ncbi:uncharacterized protein MYCFIDRAFT_180375 [Pseudocercospora fijiensis CIRAD86]|uniref:Uncharacterized protein n=1 Tax=Pseudocercospora fijiensis (strain CIRAD86) TaxID=383855 RepID=M3AIL1_PSEFD|nr:uncharacterized protein MYCFIDRAFT_180375 [Pseudocercospora fijiensis CIRAD86]EME77043.1 hypothetical protein MYCFIDRAFT_180375 [Pseudocercospora fijiensis CIRAD86]
MITRDAEPNTTLSLTNTATQSMNQNGNADNTPSGTEHVPAANNTQNGEGGSAIIRPIDQGDNLNTGAVTRTGAQLGHAPVTEPVERHISNDQSSPPHGVSRADPHAEAQSHGNISTQSHGNPQTEQSVPDTEQNMPTPPVAGQVGTSEGNSAEAQSNGNMSAQSHGNPQTEQNVPGTEQSTSTPPAAGQVGTSQGNSTAESNVDVQSNAGAQANGETDHDMSNTSDQQGGISESSTADANAETQGHGSGPPGHAEGEPMEGVQYSNPSSDSFEGALSSDGESYLATVLGSGPWTLHPNYTHNSDNIWEHAHLALLKLSKDPVNENLASLVSAWADAATKVLPEAVEQCPFDLRLHREVFARVQELCQASHADDSIQEQLKAQADILRQHALRLNMKESLDWTFAIEERRGLATKTPDSEGYSRLAPSNTLPFLESNSRVYFTDRRGRDRGEYADIIAWGKQGYGHQFVINFRRQASNHYMIIKASYFGTGTFNKFLDFNAVAESKIAELEVTPRSKLRRDNYKDLIIKATTRSDGSCVGNVRRHESKAFLHLPNVRLLKELSRKDNDLAFNTDLVAMYETRYEVKAAIDSWRKQAGQEDREGFRWYSLSRENTPAESREARDSTAEPEDTSSNVSTVRAENNAADGVSPTPAQARESNASRASTVQPEGTQSNGSTPSASPNKIKASSSSFSSKWRKYCTRRAPAQARGGNTRAPAQAREGNTRRAPAQATGERSASGAPAAQLEGQPANNTIGAERTVLVSEVRIIQMLENLEGFSRETARRLAALEQRNTDGARAPITNLCRIESDDMCQICYYNFNDSDRKLVEIIWNGLDFHTGEMQRIEV